MKFDHYHVRIRLNQTGEIRTRRMDVDWDTENDEGHIYWWTEGNFACDSNRACVFYDRDEEWGFNCREIGDDDHLCQEGYFTVIDATLPNGRVVVLDGLEEDLLRSAT